ncbi:MAG TPA: hypothetical protein VL966_05100 [Alphaproteobacteria bacterium]|nr:hypothetical protein [Alphaproteobacteria bacterium]
MDDGGLLLSWPERPRAPRSAGDGRPARIITMAWGERYVTDLLRLAIPAILAPGNIPAFCEHFETELVIVTESRFFPFIATSPAIVRALTHCDVRLLPIDDLLSPWYGVSLTHALTRGFIDLGERVTETHLVFLNADFIVADGSYRNLAQAILRGERLAVAPSYCMVLEDVVPTLAAQYDRRTATLALQRRQLARMIVQHPHNTVRAKTINRPGLLAHRYDQFYWKIGDDTLLCRQMPIAVVYMRPTRVVPEMPTFWDYGVVSEMCPGVKPCVFADSDDFLMGELRARDTFRELMREGAPRPEDIARDLSSFTTQDHRDYGRYTLVVHGGDLPAELPAERKKFESYVDAIFERLTPALDYHDHAFWAPVQPAYVAMRQAKTDAIAERRRIIAQAVATPEGQHLDAAIRSEIADIVASERNGATDDELREKREQLLHAVERFDALADRLSPAKPPKSPPPRHWARRFSAAWLLDRYHAIFGTLPRATAWHPLYVVLRGPLDALDRTRLGANALVVSSGGLLTAPLSRVFTGRTFSLGTDMATAGLYQESPLLPLTFQVCLMDLAPEELARIPELIAAVRPSLARDARIVVFSYFGGKAASGALPLSREITSARAVFTGSTPGALAADMFLRTTARYDLGSTKGRLKFMAMMAVAAPLARLAAAMERYGATPPARCTGVTLELTPSDGARG